MTPTDSDVISKNIASGITDANERVEKWGKANEATKERLLVIAKHIQDNPAYEDLRVSMPETSVEIRSTRTLDYTYSLRASGSFIKLIKVYSSDGAKEKEILEAVTSDEDSFYILVRKLGELLRFFAIGEPWSDAN